MAYSVSLVTIRTEAYQRCALEYGTQITIPEANTYINNSGAELNDLLAQACGEKYVMSEAAFSTVAAKDKYSFAVDCGAPDFMALQGLDQQIGGRWLKLKDYKFAERELYQFPYNASGRFAYRFQGANLVLSPTPTVVVSLKLYYTPTWKVLVADTDTFDMIDGWQEYIVVDFCIKALTKLDQPCEVFMKQKGDMLDRINKMKLMRDTSSPPRMIDVNDFDAMPYSTWRTYGS